MESLEKQWRSLAPAKTLCRTAVAALCSEPFECLRTGAVHDFITFELRNWVTVIAETPEKELVMIRQFRHGTRRVEWEIPAGCIDDTDSDPIEAAIRELLEETGYAGENARIIGCIDPNPAMQSNHCYTVRIDNARKVSIPMQEDTEAIETHLMTSEQVMQLIREQKLRHGLVLDAVFYYLLDISEQKGQKL